MRYRNRLIIILLMAVLIPWVVGGIVSFRTVSGMESDILSVGNHDIQALMEQDVLQTAQTIVQQVLGYAALHPDVSLVDRFALRENTDLALLAVPPVDSMSFISVYNQESVIIYHTDPELNGTNQFLSGAQSNPDLWDIIFNSLNSQTAISGYYDTTIDSVPHRMYMVAVRVSTAIPLIVSVTVDADAYLSAHTESLLEAIQQVRAGSLGLLAVMGGMGLVLILGSLWVSSRLASPVEWMGRTAIQLLKYVESTTQGYRIPTFRDEMALLNHTLGLLTRQLREQVSNLEEMVNNRTAELAQRTAQLETAAQLARESAAILDVNELLDQTTYLISERFSYYHTGIFLVDQAGEYIVLRATNSEGGRRMLERGHKLKMGQGIAGFVAAKMEPRITSDVGQDAVHFKNPDLPFTRSEMALPLKVRDRVIGVLDVQSTDPSAFTGDDVRILQILADQLALAIDNAHLFNQSQQTLRDLEQAYGLQTREAWQRRLGGRMLAYAYNRLDVQPVELTDEQAPASHTPTIEMVAGEQQITVPLLLRDQVLGAVVLRREAHEAPWSQDDLKVVSDATTQIAALLENARLLEEIQWRAQQESLVSQISSKVQTSLDVETVLRIAVREIGHALSANQVQIRLSPGYRGG